MFKGKQNKKDAAGGVAQCKLPLRIAFSPPPPQLLLQNSKDTSGQAIAVEVHAARRACLALSLSGSTSG